MRGQGVVRRTFSIFVCLAAAGAGTSVGAMAQAPERVLDQVVTLQDSLSTSIPSVARLCDSLRLAHRRVRVGDAELYVEDAGRGPAMVLINGGPGGTHHYFHPWFSQAHGFARVIYYDQRGTGLSDYTPGPQGYSVEQAVHDLDGLRSALGIDRWIVLGHSYGGFLAQLYAVRHPERVAGLVLVASSPGMWSRPRSGRAFQYISEAEQDRLDSVRTQLSAWARATGASDSALTALLIYNRFLNGDWKRQYFLRPSRERIARIALYEWTDQGQFRSQVSQSQRLIDLTGAFDASPIPTWIVEGRWDLTWDTDKAAFIQGNHPRADLTVLAMAGHEIFGDRPDAFFPLLRRFVQTVAAGRSADVGAYRASLVEWERRVRASPQYLLRSVGDDRESSERVAAAFSPSWLPELAAADDHFIYLQRIGFALYDVGRYEESLRAFGALHEAAERAGRSRRIEGWIALVWQGHMLDLLGRREEAVRRYQEAVDLGLAGGWSHPQYGLRYRCTEYASRWLQQPFQRIENLRPRASP